MISYHTLAWDSRQSCCFFLPSPICCWVDSPFTSSSVFDMFDFSTSMIAMLIWFNCTACRMPSLYVWEAECQRDGCSSWLSYLTWINICCALVSPFCIAIDFPYLFYFSEGKVVKLTPESIHVIVLGFASAVIIDEDIREEFEYRTVRSSFILFLLCFSYVIFLVLWTGFHGFVLSMSSSHFSHLVERDPFFWNAPSLH